MKTGTTLAPARGPGLIEAARPEGGNQGIRPAPSYVRPEEILAAVLHITHADEAHFCGRGRTVEVVDARTIFCVLCRELTCLSYPEIARFMCRPNHSTCATAVARYHRTPERWRVLLDAARALAVRQRDGRNGQTEAKARVCV